ncbi:pilus assembly protein [Aurantiacibacter sp. MUD11]|uniref:TadE/TadG family type IV pilus assembly protein n=1 Tax=Aurantiacibacter sp. MUD11 TaxID=3003265 RepID=UPI0022AA48AB|nr:TadE/TadG family type IV pilus assembly protein [Aurantiacibacter sp. MUD11]WAT18422.1 pilus assembly protein [Aurantiacibacter sp. MUD11]
MMLALPRMLRRLARHSSGVAMTEFALVFPFLLGLGLMGMETANRVLVQMKVSQLASQIADNAARIGEQSMLEDRKIYEGDINDLFYGAHLQGGQSIDLYEHGRVILSSLEVVPGTDGQQYIHWQRCVGNKEVNSSYGVEGDGRNTDDFPGMGPAGEEVIAFDDEAVMFVEISYDYQSLIGAPFTFNDGTIHVIASYPVRADRDLTQIYQHDQSNPDPMAECSAYGGINYATG